MQEAELLDESRFARLCPAHQQDVYLIYTIFTSLITA
jgi:hypothetical protein